MYFLIHACPSRMWYVNDYLVPSMTAQGIKKNEIQIICDKNADGNLESCMQSFKNIRKLFPKSESVWHLQDDVVIADDFAKVARANDYRGVVNGFCNAYNEGGRMHTTGSTVPFYAWFSLPCIHIPNELAEECAAWFYSEEVQSQAFFRRLVAEQKGDDTIWRMFMERRHPDEIVVNLAPNMVDHVDYLLGGSVVAPERKAERRSFYWENPEIVEKLEERLRADGKLHE